MNLNRFSFLIVSSCIIGSVAVTIYVFAASRADPGLRMAALVAATNIATALMATASTMLTGKDLSARSHDPSELPAGTLQTSTETVQTPPVTINAPFTPEQPANPTS